MVKDGQYHNILFTADQRKSVNNHADFDGSIRFSNSVMDEVVLALAKNNPTWRIYICGGYVSGSAFKCEEVDVSIDGETVGRIHSSYVRGNYGVSVMGHKIADKVRTGDPKRAMAVCRKSFVKRNTTELINHALREASSTVHSVAYSFNNKFNKLRQEIVPLALSYALEMNRENFEGGLTPIVLDVVRKYDEAALHMQTIESVKAAMNGGNHAVVIRDGERYIVKQGDNVALYAPHELPESMRGKVGMLKLCEDSQMVDNVGCRVSEEIFVIID